MKIHQVIIKFPEIKIKNRDTDKLLEYFRKLFKDHLQLLYFHFHNNTKLNNYPLIQYKVLNDIPMLIGIEEGAELLISFFQQIKELNFENGKYKILKKNINKKICDISLTDKHHEYEFATPWMLLNQDNYIQYKRLKKDNKKNDISNLLSGILTGNIFSFFKTINYHASESIFIKCDLLENTKHSKNKSMIEFKGKFTANALLPDLIGLGNSVLRGYGTISKVHKK
jgi:hypothetical protein